MDTPARTPARGVALVATIAAGVVIAAAVAAAMTTSGDLGMAVRGGPAGSAVVSWVAPDGPAWGAGVRPGDRVVAAGGARRRAPRILVEGAGGRRIALGVDTMEVARLDIPVAGLGLLVFALGAAVCVKGRDRRASWAFWRMSLAVGLALGVTPAGFLGLPWAIALTFVTLCLFGPALLDLTLAFPAMRPTRRAQRLVWLPALALALVYPLCWWNPIPLFPLVQGAGDAALVGYIVAACARIGWVLHRPRSPLQQAQLKWLALGVIGGFAPVVGLNLLPYVLVGQGLLPVQVSITTLILLPLCIGAAIVRVEFLGITNLMRRRSLHIVVWGLLLVGAAGTAGLLAADGSRRWGWPPFIAAALASALTVVGFLALRPTLTRWADRLMLRDVYDTGDTLRRVSLDLSQAPPSAVGALVVTRLSNVLDLTDALLLTPTNQWSYAHPRTVDPVAVQEAVVGRALHLLVEPPPSGCGAFVERAEGQPILFLPVWGGSDLRAVLCLGPKRSEDCYTTQDHALLDTLVRHLGLVFSTQHLQAQLEERAAARPGLLAAPGARADAGGHTHTSPSLTAREMETLRYLAEGLPNKEIAGCMFVVEKTVHKHVAAICDKLDARNRTEAVTIARRARLLPPD